MRKWAAAFVILTGCSSSSTDGAPDPSAAGTLLFQSGFEDGVEAVVVDDAFGDLRGVDASVELGDWENDLENNGRTGEFRIYVEEGNQGATLYGLETDPHDPANRVLAMRLDGPNVASADKGRVQAVLRQNPDLHAFAYDVRICLQEGFELIEQADTKVTWLTVGEFWNDLANWDHPFRVTLNVTKQEDAPGTPLTWGLHGQERENGAWVNHWEHVAHGVPVPLKSWARLRVSLRDGDDTTGHVRVTLEDEAGTEHTIIDANHRTRHPDAAADGFTDINPMKLYTSGGLLEGLGMAGSDLVVLWDDFTLRAP